MILKRYMYENRPPIIVIPKCGTRFVNGSNWKDVDEIDISTDSNREYSPIASDSIMIYRNPREHIISAIQTDYVWGNYYGKKQHIEGSLRKSNLNIIIQNMFEDNSDHWSPNLYKNIYNIWNKTNFKMLHVSNLSELFDNKIQYNSKMFDSHNMPNYKSKEEILSMIPKDKLNHLYKLCDEDEFWLNRILIDKKNIIYINDLKERY
jgi:hypothetical protein